MYNTSIIMRSLIVFGIPLLLIAFFRLQVDSIAGHMDEYDYLFVGKTLLAGGHWPSHTYIFGWDLNWLLLAWGDLHLGGLAGARRITAMLGIVSIIGVYAFVLVLWRNKTIAALSAVLLSIEAAHLFSSNLATYDIISFTFFVWSLPALILACKSKHYRGLWTCTAALLLIAAVLSKYTAVIYLPIIAAFVLLFSPKQAVIGMIIITSALVAYAWAHFEQLHVLYEIQINGVHDKNATTSDIVIRTAKQLLALMVLTILSATYALAYKRTELTRILCLILLGSPLFFYHLLGQNVISLNKHLLYTSLFLIPIVAWGLQQVWSSSSLIRFRYPLIACTIALFGVSNYQQLSIMQNSYPNVQPVLAFANQIQADESILSEDPYLFRYLLHDNHSQSRISETTWLDNNADGVHEHRDVQHAIWDKKFNYVFLNDQQHANGNKKLREMLKFRGYETLLRKPYQLSTMSGAVRSGEISLHALVDTPVTMLKTE